MNQKRLTLLFVLVFAALALLVFWPSAGEALPATPPPGAVAVEYVYDWPPEDVLGLVLDVRGLPALELRQQVGTWFSPSAQVLVDQTAAEGLVRTLAELPSLGKLEDVTPERYAEFGLSRQDLQMLIQIVRLDGTPHALVIGNRTTDDRAYYALVDDRPEVYLVLRGAVEYLAFAAKEIGEDATNP